MFDPGESPFPFTTKTGATITDERCSCGALRSEHGTTIAFGHGPRIVGGVVACERYTFVGYVHTTKMLPDGFRALDDKHAIKIERASNRAVGAKGWRYEVRDLSKGKGQRLFTCAAPAARTKTQALEHALEELRRYIARGTLELRSNGGAL